MPFVAPGTLLGRRYRILRPLGAGGLATTQLAFDAVLERDVALKLLTLGREAVGILQREFSLLSGLFHPNLCQVHDLGFDHALDAHFYTADFVEGDALEATCRVRGWQAARCAVIDALRALDCLHRLGIRHGDFKPDNVLVDRSGRGVLIDLSCARPLDEPSLGEISGTPAFLAPEILAGRGGDERSDLFGVGVTLGRLLEFGPGDDKLWDLVRRLTARDPADRPSQVAEVLEALGDSRPELAPPWGRAPRLIGRARELGRFRQVLQSLLIGEDGERVVYVRGAPGSGRSRLLREMKWVAELSCSVAEGSTLASAPVTSLLARALTDETLPDDITGALQARELVDALDEPVVLVMDDVDRLSDPNRTLFDGWVRLATRSDRALLLCSGSEPFSFEGPTVRVIGLEPLGLREIAEWAGPRVSTREVALLERWSGGDPAYVEAGLARIAAGVDLDADGPSPSSARLASELARLESGERRALKLMAAVETEIDPVFERLLGIDETAAFTLQHRGLARRSRGLLRLARSADAAMILGTLCADEARDLHRAVALALRERMRQQNSSELNAQLVRELVRAGDLDGARSLLAESEHEFERASDAWSRAADALAENTTDPQTLLLAAKIHEQSGRPQRALSLLTKLVRLKPPRVLKSAVDSAIGAAYLKASNGKRALRYLRAALESERDPERRASIMSLVAKTLILLGDHRDALERATRALEIARDPPLVAELHECIGVAAIYLGESVHARTHLKLAAELESHSNSPRARVRLASYQALADFRQGDAAAASLGYARALEIAEAYQLNDHVAVTLLNLGTALQLDGDWGGALERYETGLRAAVALGKAATEATLRFNLANLFAAIGLFDRAATALDDAAARSRALGLAHLEPHLDALRGEIDFLRDRPEPSRTAFEAARDAFAARGALREVAEMEIHLANLAISERRFQAARRLLDGAARRLTQLAAADVSESRTVSEARLELASGNGRQAIELLKSVGSPAGRGSEIELRRLLAQAWSESGHTARAEKERELGRVALERIARSLPEPFRGAFWRHPRHRAFAAAAQEPAPLDARPASARSLAHFLEVNQRLNSARSVESVFETALDAAIELTRAERGFVLVRSEGQGRLEVPVARNLDRESIGRSHLKFSRGIADRVIASGEATVVMRAADDERFRNDASVHAMRLKSVACVPIRSPRGVLGALYLDNRFEEGRFSATDVELLQAFADQVAIALTNARLVRALERRTRELEEEKRRVEELLADQAEQISRLSDEVQKRQDSLELRYDYDQIVGRSVPMRRVLSKVDRVIDSPVNVLISGESGTGKELVARAIHFNGPRRDKPLLSVNCAALPDALLESELFGHVRGAFTGADRDREGLFVAARGGAVFLDELGEMSLITQAKLLRVLQEREVRQLGADHSIRVDFRLLSATNRTLAEEVRAGRFREDLYYRLAVVEIVLPPLRDRADDIPEIAHVVLERLAKEWGRPVPTLTREAQKRLMRYEWPGNVRQLENVLAKSLIGAETSSLESADVELPSRDAGSPRSRRAFSEEEAARILALLQANRWNVSEVSRTLGIPRNTLYRKLRRHNIQRGK